MCVKVIGVVLILLVNSGYNEPNQRRGKEGNEDIESPALSVFICIVANKDGENNQNNKKNDFHGA